MQLSWILRRELHGLDAKPLKRSKSVEDGVILGKCVEAGKRGVHEAPRGENSLSLIF